MSGQLIAFFILSLCTIGGAVFMISFTRVVHMVVALAFSFLSIAGFYILLEAEFVAVTQVLVYAGAVAILMLFGIMLTRHHTQEENPRIKQTILSLLAVVVFFAFMFMAIIDANWNNLEAQHYTENNTKMIGTELFSNYVIPFEMVSVLLLVALVGAIILAKREEGDK